MRALSILASFLVVACGAEHDPDRVSSAPASAAAQVAAKTATPAIEAPSRIVETLAAGLDRPGALALAGETLYVAVAEGIAQLPKPGGATTLLARDAGVVSLALDATHLYWTNAVTGRVNTMPRAGGAITALATGQDAPRGIAVDAEHVYWAAGGAVLRAPIAGGASVTLADDEPEANAVAVDATNVYWTARGVRTAPLAGGPARTLGGELGYLAHDLAVAGGAVYWTSHKFQAVVSTTTTSSSTLSTGVTADAIVADATHLFWLSSPRYVDSAGREYPELYGKVQRTPRAGEATITLADNLKKPAGLALDGSYVYWTNRDDGTLMRTRKR